LLSEVFGVGAIADASVDERVNELELVERDIHRTRGGRELEDVTRPLGGDPFVTRRVRIRAHRVAT
jgi:hypothetical protein